MRTSIPFQQKMPVFHKLENIANMAVLTDEERDYYHISLDSYRTNMAVMEHERNEGREEGFAQGRAKGRAEGRAEGMTEGLSKGRAEGHSAGRTAERLAIVLNAKAIGMDAATAAKLTGLSAEEVEKLWKD